MPTLVQGALQARLDRLAPATREVVCVAAVIGRRFGLPLLEKSAAMAELPAALSELMRLDLIVEVSRRPAPEYRFRHGLVQEVAYGSLLEPARRELHRRIGEALEDALRRRPRGGLRPPGAHFAEADDAERAARYLLLAGDQARAVYADHEAVEHYRRAREFLRRSVTTPAPATTLFKIALIHHLAFDYEAAEDAYDAAFLCRVEESPATPPTAHMTAAMGHPRAVTPGEAYSSDAAIVIEQLFRGLLRVDHDLNVVPELAPNMNVSADGLTYLFMLREDARWSDGHPLTSTTSSTAGTDCARRAASSHSCSRTSSRPRRSTTGRSRSGCASRATTSRTCSPRTGRTPGPSTCARRTARTGACPRTWWATARS